MNPRLTQKKKVRALIKLREFEKWKLNVLVHNRQVKGLRIDSPEGCALIRYSRRRNRHVLTRDRPITRRFPSGFMVYPSAFPARRIRGATTSASNQERNHNGN